MSLFFITFLLLNINATTYKSENLKEIETKVQKRFQGYASQRVNKIIKNFHNTKWLERSPAARDKFFQQFFFHMDILSHNPESQNAKRKLLTVLSKDREFYNFTKEMFKKTKFRLQYNHMKLQKKYLLELIKFSKH